MKSKRNILICLCCLLLALLGGSGSRAGDALEAAEINGLKLRQGMTAFSTLKGRQEPRYTAEDVAAPLMQYCPDLLALDLGHNDVSDLTFLRAWPGLRRLIIVDSKTPITDISPLAELNDLEYVELFMQNITDISALEGKTRLIDLNLAHNDITDLTPLYSCTSLKRLWISFNRHLSQEQIDAFRRVNPDCEVVINEWNSTGRGWREKASGLVPHYEILMQSFRSGEYIPFEDSMPLDSMETVLEESPAETVIEEESSDPSGLAMTVQIEERQNPAPEEAETAAVLSTIIAEEQPAVPAAVVQIGEGQEDTAEKEETITSLSAAAPEEQPAVPAVNEPVRSTETARDISEYCTFNGTPGGPNHKLNDGEYARVFETGMINGESALYISVTEGAPLGALYVQWAGDSIPAAVQVPEGNEWRTVATSSGDFYADYIPVPECTECRLICRDNPKRQLTISELRVLTAGTPAENIQVWRKPEGKVDMILIHGHPDDELLWFGGALPYYAGERAKDVLVICCASNAEIRKLELCDALWACGVRIHPIHLHRWDYPASLKDVLRRWHAEDEICGLVTEYYRRYKPDVVLLHDVHGEYGHGNHQAASWIGRKCVEQAKDPSIWPESAKLYGTWDVPKVYVHLWKEKQIRMDWNQPLEAFDGKTGLQVAEEAMQMHKSQLSRGWKIQEGGEYDNALFGLYYSTVGPDVEKNDFFEHIDGREN